MLIEEFKARLRRKLKDNFIKISGKNNMMGKLISWQLPGGGIWRKEKKNPFELGFKKAGLFSNGGR